MEELQQYQVESALAFAGVQAKPEEWSNIPKLVARYCIIMKSHLQALVEHSRIRSLEEPSSSLRKFVEEELEDRGA